MSTPFVPCPNLNQLKKQAKGLFKAYRAADSAAVKRVKDYLPRLAQASEEEILAAKFTLQNAQHVIARECGFHTWEKLVSAVAPSDIQSMEDLLNLTADEVRALGHAVDYKDLVVALKGTSREVREKVLSGLFNRQRNRTFFEREMELAEFVSADEIKETQERLLQKVPDLEQFVPNLSEEYLSMKERLKDKLEQTPYAELSQEDLAELFTGMAQIAHTEGIMALHELEVLCEDSLLRQSISLTLDGTEPVLLRERLEAAMENQPPLQKTRARMIFEGIWALQDGDTTDVIESKMRSFYE